jgi:hypothetical protein
MPVGDEAQVLQGLTWWSSLASRSVLKTITYGGPWRKSKGQLVKRRVNIAR